MQEPCVDLQTARAVSGGLYLESLDAFILPASPPCYVASLPLSLLPLSPHLGLPLTLVSPSTILLTPAPYLVSMSAKLTASVSSTVSCSSPATTASQSISWGEGGGRGEEGGVMAAGTPRGGEGPARWETRGTRLRGHNT